MAAPASGFHLGRQGRRPESIIPRGISIEKKEKKKTERDDKSFSLPVAETCVFPAWCISLLGEGRATEVRACFRLGLSTMERAE